MHGDNVYAAPNNAPFLGVWALITDLGQVMVRVLLYLYHVLNLREFKSCVSGQGPLLLGIVAEVLRAPQFVVLEPKSPKKASA